MDPLLEPLPPPPELEELWRFWLLLSGTRQSGMSLQPITHQEIESAQRLHGVALTPWEVETILRLDAVSVRYSAQRAAERRVRNGT